MKMIVKSALSLAAAFVLALGTAQAASAALTPSASATVSAGSVLMPDGSTFDTSTLTAADWKTAIDELIASNVRRTKTETATQISYVFEVPAAVHGGVFRLPVSVPKERVIQPRLGFGTDGNGLYILLNSFDQNMIVGGAAAAVSAGLCAIPGLGWLSCAVLTAAVVAANVWISQNGLCPQNLKTYPVSRPGVGNRCVSY